MFLPVQTIADVSSDLIGTFTLTLPLIVLFFARALDGITGGNVSVAYAYLSDITDADHRSENFGRMAVAANLGFIFGPAIAGLLGATQYAEKLPILATIGISVAAVFIIALLLPESKPEPVAAIEAEGDSVRRILGQELKDCYEIDCEEKLTFSGVLKIKQVPLMLTLYFLVFLGFNLFYVTFPVHAIRGLNWQLTDTGTFFSFLGILMVVVQGPVLRFLSGKFAEATLAITGSFLLIWCFLLYYFSSDTAVYIAAVFFALGNGIMWPSILALLSNASSSRNQGAVQGVASSCGSMASIIGLLVGGILYEYAGEITFLISAIIFSGVFILSFKLLNFQKEDVVQEPCRHMQSLKMVTPQTNGCEECLQSGDRWVHLRICMQCGHVGCCDSSKNKHATKHYHGTKHAVVQSFEPNETWLWCYMDQQMVKLDQKMYER